MVYLDLVLNLSLLVALSIVSGFLEKHWPRRTFLGQFLQGILFGSVAVIGMLRPLNLGEGLIFDGRSIMVSLCALFFGPLASAVAGVMSIGCRLYLGGIGMITGCLVILSSLGIGLAARRFFQPETTPPSALRLYLFGLAVHLAMLFMMFTLPLAAALTILGRIGIPVLLLYPIATVLAGKILSDQVEAKRNMESLRQSEEKYRGLFNESITAVYVFDSNKNFVDVNEAGLNLLGYSREELLRMSIPDVDENSTVVLPAHEQRLSGERLINFEHKLRRKDGKVVNVLNNSKPAMRRGFDARMVEVLTSCCFGISGTTLLFSG